MPAYISLWPIYFSSGFVVLHILSYLTTPSIFSSLFFIIIFEHLSPFTSSSSVVIICSYILWLLACQPQITHVNNFHLGSHPNHLCWIGVVRPIIFLLADVLIDGLVPIGHFPFTILSLLPYFLFTSVPIMRGLDLCNSSYGVSSGVENASEIPFSFGKSSTLRPAYVCCLIFVHRYAYNATC